MEEENIVRRLLEEGSKTKVKYADFDYSKLDETQLTHIKRLSFFSKHKSTILRYIGMSKSSVEGRIAFLEKNSMKLGAVIFNRIEEARLMVNHGYYILPYFAGAVTFLSLMVFAKFTPMHSKLYRELGKYLCNP